ncbi:MAG: serine acetyltransferase [Phycisphaerales bacterium]|nr:serine acetyltransferase [Phycisphaerales bacterium]
MRAEQGAVRAADLAGLRDLVEQARRLMFPGYFDSEPLWDGEIEPRVSRLCESIAGALGQEVRTVMRYRRSEPGAEGWSVKGDDEFVHHAVSTFMRRLPAVRHLLALDVQAAYDGDPAAEHTDEIILCYPGLDAIFTHRIAHELYQLQVPLLARVMGEQAHSRTGIDIHPGAQVGESFFIDHGSATVIGETSVIGKQVKVYQGVTLGARSFPKDERGRVIRGIKRHPTIGDRVTIYAGAVILGGDTVIGDDCVIAGGVFVTSSVPPGHVVQQTRPEPVLKPTLRDSKNAPTRPDSPKSSQLGWLEDGAGI